MDRNGLLRPAAVQMPRRHPLQAGGKLLVIASSSRNGDCLIEIDPGLLVVTGSPELAQLHRRLPLQTAVSDVFGLPEDMGQIGRGRLEVARPGMRNAPGMDR